MCPSRGGRLRLVFTPVKSASVLWALGDPDVRTAVEAAHHEAVETTMGWVEQHAAYTRTGHAGAAQVDTTGLVCAASDHRESRSSDPDLHTHVAVANKICGLDGNWRSLDARACTRSGWRRLSATARGSRMRCPAGSA
ncbi:MAG: relaxase domain-containing protein [Nocardioidaceae bacterium]|nr:relaxase domain-containing protein [Nocardioidaceae bacterium]